LGNASVATLRCQVTTITALSDFRDKTDINDIQVGLSFVEKLRPVTFKWDRREWYSDGNKDGSKKDNTIQVGFIAQEYQQVLPTQVTETTSGGEEIQALTNGEPLLNIQQNLVPYLVKAIQELKATVDAQAARIAVLEGAK
jgi:hypothetical protein